MANLLIFNYFEVDNNINQVSNKNKVNADKCQNQIFKQNTMVLLYKGKRGYPCRIGGFKPYYLCSHTL